MLQSLVNILWAYATLKWYRRSIMDNVEQEILARMHGRGRCEQQRQLLPPILSVEQIRVGIRGLDHFGRTFAWVMEGLSHVRFCICFIRISTKQQSPGN